MLLRIITFLTFRFSRKVGLPILAVSILLLITPPAYAGWNYYQAGIYKELAKKSEASEDYLGAVNFYLKSATFWPDNSISSSIDSNQTLYQSRQYYQVGLGRLNKAITKQDFQKAQSLLAMVIRADRFFESAQTKIVEADTKIQAHEAEEKAKAEAEAKRLAEEEAARNRGVLKGRVTAESTPLSAATVALWSGSGEIAKTSSDQNGNYSIEINSGTYKLIVTLSGYNTYTKNSVQIVAQQEQNIDIALVKPVPVAAAPAQTSPAPSSPTTVTSSTSDSTANSTYARTSVATDRGTFTADIMTFNLASGNIKVITDTASDNDCLDDCPVLPLKDYVNRNGGFAGIHGTYFCPSDYSWCANESNYFFWKIFNSRLGKMINQNNKFGEFDHFLTFSSSGKPKYYTWWATFNESGESTYAGINSKPALVAGGQNIINIDSLDNKQKNTKTKWGALGLKGETLYAVVGWNVTMVDMASLMTALGVDYAMGIDGGGTTAVIYKGVYKLGPGRSMPNALVFVGE